MARSRFEEWLTEVLIPDLRSAGYYATATAVETVACAIEDIDECITAVAAVVATAGE